ncbi:MAG TPA: hypothetical protein VHV83_02830, partial [Armatimonadota bacterium]|nr:hypothetical protein [Armatimonadota bacterium]
KGHRTGATTRAHHAGRGIKINSELLDYQTPDANELLASGVFAKSLQDFPGRKTNTSNQDGKRH